DNSACACVPEYRKARQLCVPTHYAEASGLLMHRVGTSYDRFLVLDNDTGAGLVETGDLQSDLTGGFQTLIGWQLFGSPNTAVELSFFGLYGWDDRVSISDPGNDLLISGFDALPVLTPTPNFDNASQVDLRYSSDLYNFEANLI